MLLKPHKNHKIKEKIKKNKCEHLKFKTEIKCIDDKIVEIVGTEEAWIYIKDLVSKKMHRKCTMCEAYEIQNAKKWIRR